MSDDMLTEEDKALFRQAVEAIKPLPGKKETKTLFASSNPDLHIALSDYYTETVQPDSILCFYRKGIPEKRRRELKQGQIARQTRLDLHGLRPDDAKTALLDFIIGETTQGHRCILLVHGKGGLGKEAPVLKNLVNHWLKQIPEVLAFHSALPKDGGTGAVYVLLKRNKIT